MLLYEIKHNIIKYSWRNYMVDIEALLGYFNKLQRIILNDADFNFGSTKILKKEKIDDILCCILLLLPEPYKKELKIDYAKNFSSVKCFKILYKNLKYKFFFNSNYYCVNSNEIIKMLSLIKNTIKNDIQKLEEIV